MKNYNKHILPDKNMRTLLTLLQKEFILLIRNPFIPRMLIIFPMMVMLVIPMVTTMDVRNVSVAAVDNDKTQTSRRIIAGIQASPYLIIGAYPSSYSDAMSALESDKADVIIQIPSGYEKSMTLQESPAIDIAANGVNAMKGMIGAQYVTQCISNTLRAISKESGNAMPSDPVSVENLYNATLDYRIYMIPALMVILVIMICGFLPALNLVEEKESGSIEQINVSPVSRLTFTLSKLIPYWIAGMVILSLAMLIARMAYGLAPAGSVGTIYMATFLFSLVMSGIGITIANGSSNMQQCMFVMFFFIIIFQLMSGLMTPIDSMPQWAQYITYAIPPRYFIEIMRSVYLKGTPATELIFQLSALMSMAAAMSAIAAATYRKRG